MLIVEFYEESNVWNFMENQMYDIFLWVGNFKGIDIIWVKS